MKSCYTLKELAEICGLQLQGDPEILISGVEEIEKAQSTQISFVENERYRRFLNKTQAGAIIISSQEASKAEGTKKNFLISPTPSLSFQQVIELFISETDNGFTGVSPSATIHETVVLGKNVLIEPQAVICKGVVIGDNCHIGAGCFIGAETVLGNNCCIHPRAVVRERVLIGNNVLIQSGAVIGSCGFGYSMDKSGNHVHLKHLGKVVLEDNVEIGANTTIDRGRFKETIVRQGTKIDNLVQIAHQVEVGKHSIIVSLSGIAGSTKIGNRVVVGGQTGIAGHISVCDNVMLMAQTGVSKTISSPGVYGGAPARPYEEIHKIIAKTRNLPKMDARIGLLEKQLEDIKQKLLVLNTTR
ncbi:UDP-3-O-(3-hydroxymyristoyl)glucosamine N-acyltransferase [Chlamydiifrater phoenicopteri]|uniref:UDP-3-O-(3-hydroxymyristoyl)glucosamine N-acyltransferase n=1 Tax=Chlamydiifrater phoenicopteri TaxID=2681469 RepID=UPI001BCFC823|nr:UDP-3-O-(3-hydroxymyristoyl)glucosamine N-acyltransferase [Chlamydiifrater phoenicopteri]